MGAGSSGFVGFGMRGRGSVRRGCGRWWGVMGGWGGGLDGEVGKSVV